MAPEFDDVQAYCFFIGYPRSGHSIIGALLDAHPQAAIAHELGALQYVRWRFDRDRLFYLLARNARESAAAERPSGEFRYRVDDQWQGRFTQLRVVGDNQAEGATLRLRVAPQILARLQRTVRVPLRVIHIVRNPFDNITTMAIRAAQRAARMTGSSEQEPDLGRAFDRYRVLSEHVAGLREKLGESLHELRHEDFVADPRGRLAELCEFLGLDAEADYLDASAATVWGEPRQTRHNVPWSPDLRASVEQMIADTPHLAGYRFDS